MANELRHSDVGTALSQSEWEAVGAHIFNSQAAGDIVYASTTSQLTRLGIGTANQVLATNSGATAPEWVTGVASATLAATVTVVDSTDTSSYIAMFDSATGSLAAKTDAGITYNAGTGMLTATGFTGPLTGTLVTAAQGNITSVGTLTDLTVSGSSTTVGTVTSGIWQGTAIASGYIAADAITGAKIADDAIDSEHYTDGSIDNAHIADDQIDSEHYAAASIDFAHIQNVAANSILGRNANSSGVLSEVALTTTQILIGDGTGFTAAALSNDVTMTNAGAVTIANNAVTLAKMAGGTDGNIISYDASGDPVAIATGSDGQVLTSTGAGSPPAFETVPSAGTPTTITVADSSNATASVAFFESATGDLGPKTDSGLTYNAGTGMLTATGFTGPLTGNASGTAATVTGAAQSAITSLGTLTTLTVDSIIINGTNIGHTSDTDAIAISSGGVVTMNQIPVFSAGINVSGGSIAGTIATASQTNITSVGTITTGTWQGTTVAVNQGGTGATALTNLITMGSHTTGDFVGTITAGTGLTSTGGTSGEDVDHSLSVDASQTQITAVGTIATGTWQGTTVAVDQGGTGATSLDNLITLAHMAHGTDGNLITYGTDTAPAFVATGDDGQVLTSAGAGNPPAFETLSAASQGFAVAMALIF